MKTLLELLIQTARNMGRHNVPSFAAAIAYHTIISLGPLLLFSIFIASRAFGRDAAIEQLETALATLVGQSLVDLFRSVLVEFRASTTSRLWATGISFFLLLYSASNVFRQLVVAQNAIWEVERPSVSIRDGFWRWVRIRLRHYVVGILTAIVVMFALLGSMFLSVVAGLILQLVETIAPGLTSVLAWGSFILIPLLFIAFCLLGFKLLPAVKPDWREVLPGAIVTGLVLALSEGIIVYYARTNPIPTFFGIAGSLVIVMLWAYFSALIFLIGAEFTHVYSVQKREP
jgi:membrane protein